MVVWTWDKWEPRSKEKTARYRASIGSVVYCLLSATVKRPLGPVLACCLGVEARFKMDPISVDDDSVNKNLANKCQVITTSNVLAQVAAASAGKCVKQFQINFKLIGSFSISGICSIGTELGLVITCTTSTRFQFNRLQNF